MSRSAYFEYLEETAEAVGPHIEKLLQPYRELQEGLFNELLVFAGSRLRRPLQKPALFRLAYEICGGKDWERYIPVAVAFELLNISSYQANASFDHKLATLTDDKKDAQFICSMISRELATKILRECSALSAEALAGLEVSIGLINEHIYLAQYYDLFVLNVSRFKFYLADEHLFLADYERRCFLGSGIFNGQICYWGGCLAEADGKRLSALKAFGEAFGTALQMANDIGDYAPPDSGEPNPRDYQDRYSDCRNGRLTAILYHYLVNNSEEAKTLVNRSGGCVSYSPTAIESLVRACIQGGSVAYARGLVAKLSKQADDALDMFGSLHEANLFKQLSSIVRANKYYGAIRNYANGKL